MFQKKKGKIIHLEMKTLKKYIEMMRAMWFDERSYVKLIKRNCTSYYGQWIKSLIV